jgi:hypothetical protein
MQAGDKIEWSDLGGTTYRGVCIYVDADDPVFPWKVADDDGVAHWIGPQNEPFVIDAPTAWTTERPTEPGWYFVRDAGKPHTMECVDLQRTLNGKLRVYRAGVDDGDDFVSWGMGCEWQRAEPKP